MRTVRALGERSGRSRLDSELGRLKSEMEGTILGWWLASINKRLFGVTIEINEVTCA
jgi:hypothetical protein